MIIFKNKYGLLFLISLFLFFIFLYFNSYPKIISIIEAISLKKNLISQIDNDKKILFNSVQNQPKLSIHINTELPNESDLIDNIARFFSEQNFTVNKIQLFKPQTISGINAIPTKINAIGEFSAIAHLMKRLEKNKYPILINDFSIQMSHGVTLIEMQLLVFSLHLNETQ
ncbi:MAG: hypothetical protein K0R24_542 [Gammaproteobacteria bacterium]|jgi:hypothetical protein|nr:hypothetical protein [Gammaproteobacteria bacterium]